MTSTSILGLCPDCPGVSAARDLVFADGLLLNAWYALLPFAASGIIVHLLVRRLSRRGAR